IYGIITALLMQFREKAAGHSIFFRYASRILSVCLFAELFIFNFGSAHLLAGSYEQKELDLSTAVSSNFDFSSHQNISAGNTSFEFRNINMPVGTVEFQVESSSNPSVYVSIDMSDDTYSTRYRGGIASAEIIKDNERSKFAVCNFSGNVHDIKFNFQSHDNEYITISGITLNSPAPLRFSFVRFFILFAAGMIFYFLTASPVFRRSFADSRKAVIYTSWLFTALLVAVSLLILNSGRYNDPNHSIAADFHSKSGNQISKEIVDAFEAGSVEISGGNEEQMSQIDNPYDGSQLEDAMDNGIISYYMWDHLFYNGKYYSYYGIGPVLVIFLPYHMITGYYFPCSWAVWLFSAGGILFLTALYLSFMKRFFSRIRSSLVLSGLALVQLVT
ncbi:MAG: hypothetical protein K2J37_03585, partial [Ruminococcus sp.]|nr:hypothetical protein [Ruminococcus sp.]